MLQEAQKMNINMLLCVCETYFNAKYLINNE